MKPNKTIALLAAGILLLAITISGCSKEAMPGPNAVYMQNIAFTPSSLTVPVNTTVTWTNKDNTDHTVTSDNEVFDAGIVSPGTSFSFKFTQTGDYPYHCKIHSTMHGTIVVQ